MATEAFERYSLSRAGEELLRLHDGLDRYREFVRLLCTDQGITVHPMTPAVGRAWARVVTWERRERERSQGA